MLRLPGFVVACGVLSTLFGVGLLLAPRDGGVFTLGIAITIFGLVLLGYSLFLRMRDARTDPSEAAVMKLPGRWYPYAILAIAAALMAWAIYWTKFR